MLFEPGVEHRIGTAMHSFYPNLSCGRMEQAHELGRAIPQVLVRLVCIDAKVAWLAGWTQVLQPRRYGDA